ncbi:MAG: thiamine biosynthesis protein [Frankiales bacterium]|nr:thiamine biosynthesis protein [Frankiales bacterium]
MSSTRPAGAQRHVEHCMGTVFSIDIRRPGVGAEVVADMVRWLHWVDATFSTYQSSSEVSRLRRQELTLPQCSPEVRTVLEMAAQIEAATGGYFSIYPNGVLDPSGLVKGWAIEQASNLLQLAGSTSHCLNGGGDVQCVGNYDGGDWRIGIADPHRRTDVAAVVAGTDLAVATSGTAERGPHILDPHDGSAVTELASLTVVGSGITLTDAYATAGFAMGLAAIDWLEGLAGFQALAITRDGERRTTSGFRTAAPPPVTARH